MSVDSELLAFLRSVDSPTISNAIENLRSRDRCDGYIGGSVRCMFPELGVMVGHALTVTMDSQPGPVVSHGNFRIVDVGVSVTLDGQRIQTGDLLHGDLNGIVVVPTALLAQLPDAVEQVRCREKKMLDYVRGPDFNLKGFRDMGGY